MVGRQRNSPQENNENDFPPSVPMQNREEESPVVVEAQENSGEGSTVFWDGQITRRMITKEEWEAAGVQNQDTVVWERKNGYEVPKSELSEQALEVLLKDSAFSVR